MNLVTIYVLVSIHISAWQSERVAKVRAREGLHIAFFQSRNITLFIWIISILCYLVYFIFLKNVFINEYAEIVSFVVYISMFYKLLSGSHNV